MVRVSITIEGEEQNILVYVGENWMTELASREWISTRSSPEVDKIGLLRTSKINCIREI